MFRIRRLRKYILLVVLFPTFFMSMVFLLKTEPGKKVHVGIHRDDVRQGVRILKRSAFGFNRSISASKRTPRSKSGNFMDVNPLTSKRSSKKELEKNWKSRAGKTLPPIVRPLSASNPKSAIRGKLGSRYVQHAVSSNRTVRLKPDRNSFANVSQGPNKYFKNRKPRKKCDKECERFRTLLQRWPEGKPRAAFYYLTQRSRVDYLYKSLASVDKYFNNRFRYPIIIFIEEDYVSSIPDVRKLTDSDLYFQVIEFTLPSFITKPVEFNIPCLSHIGYRHMCRFHAKMVFEEPIIEGLDYYWRLDDDSRLLSPVNYDVFDFMRKKGLQYGYSWIHLDAMSCTEGLWEATTKYIKAHKIKPHFYHKWPQPSLYYNNFEISKMGIWTSEKYSKYIDYVDRLGGIFYHRWGDAPIKGIAVSLFVPQNKTHHFKDIGYQHGSYVRDGSTMRS